MTDVTKPLPDDDELDLDVSNDPVPEPAQPEDDGSTEPQGDPA